MSRPDIGLMRRALETLRIRTDWNTNQSADEVARFIVMEYERQRENDLVDDLRRRYPAKVRG